MSPQIENWSASDLTDRVQVTMRGRRRKNQIELQACQLFEMLQYECELEDGRKDRGARVICTPVKRLFRRCKDGNETFMVETTAWEGRR